MSAPLSPERLAEIRGLDVLGLVGERNAGQISAHFAVLLTEVDRLRAEFGDAAATVARLEQKRVELERIGNAERERVTARDEHAERLARELVGRTTDLMAAEARVAELEAERHSTNEALDDAVTALRDANTAAALVAEYIVPMADRAWLTVRREPGSDRWSIRRHQYQIHVWTGDEWVTPDEALEQGTLWVFGSADAALAEATRLAEAGDPW